MGHMQNDVHNTEMCVILPWIGEGSSRWAARRKNYSADRRPLCALGSSLSGASSNSAMRRTLSAAATNSASATLTASAARAGAARVRLNPLSAEKRCGLVRALARQRRLVAMLVAPLCGCCVYLDTLSSYQHPHLACGGAAAGS